MQERVEQYLKQAEEKAAAAKKAERDSILIKAGLYDTKYVKEYTENAKLDSNSGKYYLETPLEVTDEEFEAIKAAYEASGDEKKKDGKSHNDAATVLTVIGVLTFIGSIILSIMAENWLYFIPGFIAMMLYLGFAEALRLLQTIKDRLS